MKSSMVELSAEDLDVIYDKVGACNHQVSEGESNESTFYNFLEKNGVVKNITPAGITRIFSLYDDGILVLFMTGHNLLMKSDMSWPAGYLWSIHE